MQGSISRSLDCFFGMTRLRSSSTLKGDSYRRPDMILDSTGGGPVPAGINPILCYSNIYILSNFNILPKRTRKKEERSIRAGLFIITGGLFVTAAIILTVRCSEGAEGRGRGGGGGGAVTLLDTSGQDYLRKYQLAPPARGWAGLWVQRAEQNKQICNEAEGLFSTATLNTNFIEMEIYQIKKLMKNKKGLMDPG